jgi:hypothetical protein
MEEAPPAHRGSPGDHGDVAEDRDVWGGGMRVAPRLVGGQEGQGRVKAVVVSTCAPNALFR